METGRIIRDARGTSTLEYALVLALAVIVAIGAIRLLGAHVAFLDHRSLAGFGG